MYLIEILRRPQRPDIVYFMHKKRILSLSNCAPLSKKLEIRMRLYFLVIQYQRAISSYLDYAYVKTI